ncbi:hypothetical protein S83_051255, partial [Arachis hypogaea]
FDSLSLILLETIVKNCEKAFSEVAVEKVLDYMVRSCARKAACALALLCTQV